VSGGARALQPRPRKSKHPKYTEHDCFGPYLACADTVHVKSLLNSETVKQGLSELVAVWDLIFGLALTRATDRCCTAQSLPYMTIQADALLQV